MTGYSASFKPGRYNAEMSTLMVPRKPNPAKRAIIYAHGAQGDGGQIVDWKTQKSLCKFFGQFAHDFVILSGDWGGPLTFANDAELAAMEAGWAWLKASGLCATDKVILAGGSMGSWSTQRFALEHPTWVAGLNLWVPAMDIEAGRTADLLGLRDSINAAWGLPAGSYQELDGSTVPARGNVFQRAPELGALPTHLWWSSADTVTTPAMIADYIARRGTTGVVSHQVSTTLGHGDPAIGASDPDAILTFFQSIA